MKRILLTLSCIISIVWFMPLFVHAEYTAPDGLEYEYKLESTHYGSFWGSVYTNYKVCFCENNTYKVNGNYMAIGLYDRNDRSCCGYISTISASYNSKVTGAYPSGVAGGNTDAYQCFYNNTTTKYDRNSTLDFPTNLNPDIPIFDTLEDCYNYLTTPDVDYDNLFYDPTVPTPNYVVSMTRPAAWESIDSETNYFDVTWSDYPDYYIQIGYKYSVPNGMKVALVDGSTNYIPLTYYNSSFYNIYSLQDLHTAQNLNNSVNSTSFVWNADAISDPESWNTSVPIWANNYNNSAYAKARNNWNTKYMYCMPLFGNKLEIFARLFYVADGQVYVGAWKHWNNSYPNEFTEEIPNNYQVGSAIPGYENTSNNTDYQDLENTQTSIGNQTGASNTPTVVVNNLTQNYPDYPTVATYNHDNLLLQFFSTATQLPASFKGFTAFLSASLTWIPSYVWDIIAFGLLASITVMVIKIL